MLTQKMAGYQSGQYQTEAVIVSSLAFYSLLTHIGASNLPELGN
jgi:hypothetical protein